MRMKRILFLTTMVVALLFGGCEKYDDSALTNRIDNLEERVKTLEELCRQMNTNISSLQTIVSALQNNDYVTGVAPITKNGETIGYTITFTKSQPITIYHGENGKDGQNGTNGTNGADGKDGSTPVIGVKMDDDGIYYWTLNSEWLTDDNGNKIKAVGTDGKDGADGKDGQNGTNGTDGQNGTNGADGKDGITPQLKIEDGYWLISYDNGATWIQLGKATGEDGAQGPQGEQGMQGPQGEQGNDGAQGPQGEAGINGDSFFQSVTQDENNVYIVLADGTEITIPKKINLDDVKLTYIPRYDDGKATVIYSYKSDSYVELDFEVSPASKAADWSDITTVKAVYTESRAGVEFVEMDILLWTTDATNGTISIKASGKNLSDDFFDGNQSASVRIAIENDDVNIISDYIPMIAERLPMPESNEIWYTATEKVTPDASDVFGANIVSNEWDESTGQGVITFDGNVTSIGNHAFYGCSSLTSITIPESVTSIETHAFSYCSSLTSITLPDGVTVIGLAAFSGCSSLTSITIPEGVTSIVGAAFDDCSSLTSITIPEGVTYIGSNPFTRCVNLKEFNGKFASTDGRCLIVDGVLNSFAPAGLTEYTIPESVSVIGNCAFEGCSSLTTITISESVTSIGEYAFRGCSSLTSITIPESVSVIGKSAFDNCSSLTDIAIPDSVTSIGDGAFNGCSSLTSVTIPDSVTSIRYNVFANCTSLTSITIPDSVTWILGSAFHGCTSLTSITIPDSVPWIDWGTFYGCSSLTSIVSPDSVTAIGGMAFRNCDSLTSVTIPDSVTSIGMGAFDSCSSLKSVYCKPTTPPNGKSNMFLSNASGRKIYVPASDDDSIINAYKTADYWSDYADAFEEYEFD